jgi:hypothetical protein
MYEVTLKQMKRREHPHRVFAVVVVPGMLEGRPVVNLDDVIRFRRHEGVSASATTSTHESESTSTSKAAAAATGSKAPSKGKDEGSVRLEKGVRKTSNTSVADADVHTKTCKYIEVTGVVRGFGTVASKNEVIVELAMLPEEYDEYGDHFIAASDQLCRGMQARKEFMPFGRPFSDGVTMNSVTTLKAK